MVDCKENYKLDLGVKGLTIYFISPVVFNHPATSWEIVLWKRSVVSISFSVDLQLV